MPWRNGEWVDAVPNSGALPGYTEQGATTTPNPTVTGSAPSSTGVPTNAGTFNPFAFNGGSLLNPFPYTFNPNAPGGMQPGVGGYANQGGQGGGGSTDPNQFVSQFANLPWVANNPSYWTGVIAQNGGLTPENQAYWAQRMTDPPGQGSNAGGFGGGAMHGAAGQVDYTPLAPYQASNISTPTYNAPTFNAPGEFNWNAPVPNAPQNPQAFNYGGPGLPGAYQQQPNVSAPQGPAATTTQATPLTYQPFQSAGTYQGAPSFDAKPNSQTFNAQPFSGTFDAKPLQNTSFDVTPLDVSGLPKLQTPDLYKGAGDFTYTPLGTPNQFVAPDAVTMQNDPGYQFRLKQGQQQAENAASRLGTANSGAFVKAQQEYGQDYASNEYGNVYNRALQNYTTNRDTQFAAQGTQFGQGLQAYDANAANKLNTYQTNATTQLGAENQQFSQALAGQGQAFTQRAQAAGLNADLQNQRYGQELAGFQANAGAQAQGFGQGLSTSQQQAALQNQGFGQGLSAAEFNAQNGLNTFNTNANYGLASNAQQFGQASTANAQNFGQSLAANNQNFGQASTASQNGFLNSLQANSANSANANQAFGNNLALNNQGFGQAQSTYQNTFANQLAAYQAALAGNNQAYGQASGTYGLNAQTQLGAFNANAGAQQAAASLNQAGILGAGALNNSNNQFGYGQAMNQNQFGAQFQLGQNQFNAGFGLQANQQNFNQGLQTFNANAGQYNTNLGNQYNMLTGLAGLGNPGNPSAGSYGANLAELYAGQGNAQAGGIVGGANAQNGMIQSLANSGLSLAQIYAFLGQNPQAKPNSLTPMTALPGYIPPGGYQVPFSQPPV